MRETTGTDATLTVWWVPDCGHLHLEVDPTVIPLTSCPFREHADEGCQP